MAKGQSEAEGLRVGLVAACAFPAPRGSQILVQEMASALVEHGMVTHLIAPLDRRVGSRSFFTHPVEPAVPRARAGGIESLLRPVVDAALVARLAATVRRERLEVLLAHNYEGLLAALAVRAVLGVPVVYHSHNVLADELPTYSPTALRSLAARVGRLCDRTLPRQADRVVTLSEDVAGYLADCGVAEDRISVIPPGLDRAPFASHRASIRQRSAIFTGNLDGYQNLDLLLDAWSLVEASGAPGDLVLATHVRRGAELARIRRRIQGRRVELRVVESLDEMAQRLGSAMVGVSPRTSWSGFPIKTLNHMASATPTIALASSAKGVRDGLTGWVVREETPEGLAAALREALGQPRECSRRGRAALAVLRREHDWKLLAPRVAEAAELAVRAPQPAADGVGTPGGLRAALRPRRVA
jgi:glycosyltransferase involved in cell wall biosynthesis